MGAVYICIMALLLVSCTGRTEAVFQLIGDCYETWSRCTKWSSFATGILWKSCEDRCKELGYSSGDCVLVPSKCPLAEKAYQCQCSGKTTTPFSSTQTTSTSSSSQPATVLTTSTSVPTDLSSTLLYSNVPDSSTTPPSTTSTSVPTDFSSTQWYTSVPDSSTTPTTTSTTLSTTTDDASNTTPLPTSLPP